MFRRLTPVFALAVGPFQDLGVAGANATRSRPVGGTDSTSLPRFKVADMPPPTLARSGGRN